jgi:YjbE family integral membrane protein
MLEQLQAEFAQPVFWLALGKIIWIDVFLSGDNALVIAMVCRGLPPAQRFWGMILGAAGAVLMRVAFTGVIATLMEVPYLKLVGGVALLYVAVKMLAPQSGDESDVKQASNLWAAIGIVMMADAAMSIDNVIAVAAAANGSILLLGIGLALSIPLIVAGASLIVRVLDRYPLMIWAGAALLGWVAGEVIVSDPIIAKHLATPFDSHLFYAAIGACAVLLTGSIWRGVIPQRAAASHFLSACLGFLIAGVVWAAATGAQP